MFSRSLERARNQKARVGFGLGFRCALTIADVSQRSLPFDEFASGRPPHGSADGEPAARPTGVEAEDDLNSSEENQVQVFAEAQVTASDNAQPLASLTSRIARPSNREGTALKGGWPACLTWADALTYSSLSAPQLLRWQKTGALRVRKVGRNGARVVLRSELDQLLEQLFASSSVDIAEDFDFG